MKNKSLADDYILRAGHRLEALEVLMKRESYADVVREAQEIVELCLKAVLRKSRVEVPRLHDVSEVLQSEEKKLPAEVRTHLKKLCQISHSLRRDRELAFYAAEALKNANWVYSVCK